MSGHPPQAVEPADDLVFNEGYEDPGAGLYVASARGCRITDEAGRTYIDLNLGSGTAILGHAHPVLVAAIAGQAERGTLFIRPNRITHDLAALMGRAVPHFGGFAFCNSGAEATMRACRIARAHTGRKKIAMFSGGWHGAHDQLLVEEDYRGNATAPRAHHRSGGIPPEMLDLIMLLPYNDKRAFNLIEDQRRELAMVLIEPAQGSNPRGDVEPFLRRLRDVTRSCDVLLGFDEIITGFRVAFGGAQELYGIQADLATYGKILGGGLSIGAVGARGDVISCIRHGRPDDPRPVTMGGTFSANPLAMAAGRAALSYLEANRHRVYPELNANGAKLIARINEACDSARLPVHANGVGAMFRVLFAAPPIASRRERDAHEAAPQVQKMFYECVMEHGVHVGSNRINFLSTEHGLEEIAQIGDAFVAGLDELRRGGHLPQTLT
jgi:glutamate-1-semialdehyde 2,1-aminomutase